MKTNLTLAIFAFGVTVSVVPMWAHHSVPAQYDTSKTITIRGTITKIDWINPHAHVWIDAKNEDGTVSTWELELPAPNALKRGSADTSFVKQGDQVAADLWRAKDGSRQAHALTLTTADGRVLNFPRNWMQASR
jgi:hypothetical protein